MRIGLLDDLKIILLQIADRISMVVSGYHIHGHQSRGDLQDSRGFLLGCSRLAGFFVLGKGRTIQSHTES